MELNTCPAVRSPGTQNVHQEIPARGPGSGRDGTQDGFIINGQRITDNGA